MRAHPRPLHPPGVVRRLFRRATLPIRAAFGRFAVDRAAQRSRRRRAQEAARRSEAAAGAAYVVQLEQLLGRPPPDVPARSEHADPEHADPDQEFMP